MFIDTRAIDYALTEPIKDRVEARVHAALYGVTGAFHRVMVRLQDVNAVRGGVDKRCSIVVALHGRPVAIADATDVNLYRAIDEAARRVRRIALRAAKRNLSRERREAQRPGALMANWSLASMPKRGSHARSLARAGAGRG